MPGLALPEGAEHSDTVKCVGSRHAFGSWHCLRTETTGAMPLRGLKQAPSWFSQHCAACPLTCRQQAEQLRLHQLLILHPVVGSRRGRPRFGVIPQALCHLPQQLLAHLVLGATPLAVCGGQAVLSGYGKEGDGAWERGGVGWGLQPG